MGFNRGVKDPDALKEYFAMVPEHRKKLQNLADRGLISKTGTETILDTSYLFEGEVNVEKYKAALESLTVAFEKESSAEILEKYQMKLKQLK